VDGGREQGLTLVESALGLHVGELGEVFIEGAQVGERFLV